MTNPPGDDAAQLPDFIEPVLAATVLLVTPGHGGLEVLMVRRPPRGFFGGVWVFPGGTVDPGDHSADDSDLEQAFRRAAVRELAEEVGMVVDASSLAFVSRWVTPTMYPRRYDTHFYLAHMSTTLPLTLARDELEEAAYITPAAALSAHQAQQWPMVLPTLAHLRWLARFTSIDQALEATSRARLDPVSPAMAADGSLVPVDIPW